jgi:hypothetical protein
VLGCWGAGVLGCWGMTGLQKGLSPMEMPAPGPPSPVCMLIVEARREHRPKHTGSLRL